jgi:hypothetical protein
VSPITILGVCIFAIVLILRVQAWKARPTWSPLQQRMKLARVVAVALLAFLAIAMRLRWTVDDLNGKPRQPLSWWEQILEKH